MPIIFGNVQHPPFVDRLIPDWQNSAWDDLGSRRPIGVCQHSMVGSLWGTDTFFRNGAASAGLTDYGIGGAADGPQWDGAIFRWNDPGGHSHHNVNYDGITGKVSKNRAGWANGGADGLEGDGPLFVRTFGTHAINTKLVSIERSDGGDIATPMSPKQFESICALTAYWFDYAKVPWDHFPVHPKYRIVTHFLHSEFATKKCPFPAVSNRIGEVQNRVRQILKTAQTQEAVPEPLPPITPPAPDHSWWPAGYDAASLAARFGTLLKHNPDGSLTPRQFDPNGVISNAWSYRGASEHRTIDQLPRPLDWWVLPSENGQTSDLITFEDRWVLFRPDSHVVWRWIG
jgi:hypothetical protein